MRWWNNTKTAMLLALMMGVFMAIGYYILGPQGVIFGFILGGVGNLIAYFFSAQLALKAMRAQEVQPGDIPWLFEMVRNLSDQAGLPMPKVYVCPQMAPNAFATGRNPKNAAVAVTQGMLRSFPQHEIEGVLAHEIAHIRHRDVLISTIAATFAGVISYAGYALLFMGGRDRESPFGAVGALAMVILAPIAAMLIQMAISRQREYAADSYGGELCGSPLKLAAALERLHVGNERIPTDTPPAFHSLYIAEPLSPQGASFAGLFNTHPPMEKRIAVLRQQAAEMG